MPSKTDTQRGGAKRPVLDELENYFLDGDLEDDPFGSPNANEARNKRQDSEGLGIDEAVSVQKRAREPRVKLDETRSGCFLAYACSTRTNHRAADCSQRMELPNCDGVLEVSN